METILKVKNLTMKYSNQVILHDVSFDVESGDFITVIGANGSGKTTLVKGIIGTKEPNEGELIRSENLKIGYLPQSVFAKDKNFPATVKEVVKTGLVGNKAINRRQKNEMVKQALKKLNIEDLENKMIGSLSGGQQQRVLLARALVNSGNMLILDEPTSALDPNVRHEFYTLLSELNKKMNVTIMLISHNLEDSTMHLNKIMYLDRELKFMGSYAEFENSEFFTLYSTKCPVHCPC